MITRKCNKCNTVKALENFVKSKDSLDGYRRRCKQCRNDGIAGRFNEKWRGYSQRSRRKLKQWVMNLYGGCCVCCSEVNIDFLTLDHIKDDGSKIRGRGRTNLNSGYHLYRQIRMARFAEGPEAVPRDLQVLCWNCQW